MNYNRLLGGILLIIGTCIGGGMLALPVANAAVGFWPSTGFLFLCWAVMTAGAFLMLEANLYLSAGSNMISMAKHTLGSIGSALTWITYLILLYTLLSAYISGGGDVFASLFEKNGAPILPWQSCILFTTVFGAVVYNGIRKVDWLNRALMFGKLGAFLLLILLIAPKVTASHLYEGDVRQASGRLMILITSFGFAIIVPSLRTYFEDDIVQLKKAILIGSLIPLACYIAWDTVIIGALPTEGSAGLNSLMHSERTTSELALLLNKTLHHSSISTLFNFFISISMLTAFLGVSLSLFYFLSDGTRMHTKGRAGAILTLLTFVPPIIVVIYAPGAYLYALAFAGIFCVLLLVILPALMTLVGRKKGLNTLYTAPGGQFTPYFAILFGALLVLDAIASYFKVSALGG